MVLVVPLTASITAVVPMVRSVPPEIPHHRVGPGAAARGQDRAFRIDQSAAEDDEARSNRL